MPNYRKIYELYYGEIPKEIDGRPYDIHHKDGNRENNDPQNLIALPIKDHYELHLKQGDYRAAHALSLRMKLDYETIKQLASKAANERVKNGTHHWLGGEIQKKNSKKLVEDGKHYWVQPEHSEKVKIRNIKLLESGQHPFQRENFHFEMNKKRIQNGNHSLTKKEDGSSVGGNNTKKLISEGKHHWQNSEKQKELNRKFMTIVERIDEFGNSVIFESISEAKRNTKGVKHTSLFKLINKGGGEMFGYRWNVIQKGQKRERSSTTIRKE